MDRITLANLHEQLDSLRSTSIPQVKRYFRKRIVRCINECKTQALNMKKSIEPSSSNSRQELPPNVNDYEFGWGSDFDEDDDEEEETGQLTTTLICDNRGRVASTMQSLSSLHLTDCTSNQSRSQLSQSVSLQSFDGFDSSSHLSAKGSCWSSLTTNIRRPIAEPPPPPLPKEPPPNVLDENPSVRMSTCRPGISEDAYETMSPSNANCDDEYLLPNCAPKSAGSSTLGSAEENSNYEYIQYSQMDSQATNSSDSGSILSSTSRSNLKFDSEVLSDRPLPPIPKEESVEDLLLSSFSWFHDLERDEAEMLLKRIRTDGVYLVRKSRRAGASNPFTLTLFHDRRIFHLNVRRRSDGLYALGKEKHKEKTFATVAELVEHHNTEPIHLTSKGQAAGKTRLIYTPSANVTQS